MKKPIEGFSKLTKSEKLDWVTENYTNNSLLSRELLKSYWNPDEELQKVHDEFIENTLSNYYVPFAVAPNFLINDKLKTLPMAIEESSVVAAASNAAKFWLKRGGFKAKVLATEKVGQVHFMFFGDSSKLEIFFREVRPKLYEQTEGITKSMRKRGGGIKAIEFKNLSDKLAGYHQLHCVFETKDAMGANFINSCLEQFATTFRSEAASAGFAIEIIMSILSNYVPNCLVRAEVGCAISERGDDRTVSTKFAEKMEQAVAIAKVEPYRAVTHNKGIMNGIDAVVLATGNDFRAIEAGVQAYAAKDGAYSSLSHAEIKDSTFAFSLEIPLALGTVGGLTSLHPLAKLSMEILGNPSSKELMQIVAVAGLAQNFAALRSLVTTGIQKGHMKMHLLNLLNQLGANELEKQQLVDYFKAHTITNAAAKQALKNLRD